MIELYWRAICELGLRLVLERLLERLRRLGLEMTATYGCEACGAKWPHMFPFMVDDSLWDEVTGDRQAELCLACFEAKMLKKIGRQFLPSDFTDCSTNEPIHYVLRIGRCGG